MSEGMEPEAPSVMRLPPRRFGDPRVGEEEQAIRDWLAGQLNPVTGAPLPPSRRTSQPLPRRQVIAVIATLVDLLDEARR